MLKPDDPAWAELVADIQVLVSSRYVENPEQFSSLFPAYVKSKGKGGFEFSSLHRGDQRELFKDTGFFDRYADQGITDGQMLVIMGNVLDGKPQEKWLEGIFDPGKTRMPTLAEILEKIQVPEPSKTQERGGREM